jgi:tetratricopeptide (TPR) repeat protein
MEEHDRAIAAGQRALALGTTSGAFDVQVVAQMYLGFAYHRMGAFGQASDVSRQVMALLTDEWRSARFGQVALPAVASRGCVALSLAELGGFVEGYSAGEEAVRLAEAVEQPYSMAYALSCVGLLSRRQGMLYTAIPVLERGVALCQRVSIPHFFPQTAAVLSTAYGLAGRIADALLLLDQTLERVASGSRILNLALVLTELSEALLLVGRVDEASVLAERLRELSHSHTGHGYQAHAYWLLGDVARRREPPDIDQAATHYRQALALAEEMGMRPLQAHCHLGLGTLYTKTDQWERAHVELSAAIDLYRALDMTFWLPQAEAMLAQVDA